jgi:hypothetical protein
MRRGSREEPHITVHAQERVTQRVGVLPEEACDFLHRAWKNGRRVPPYKAAILHRDYKKVERKNMRYRLFENILVLCRDRAILTMWKLKPRDVEDITQWLKKNASR